MPKLRGAYHVLLRLWGQYERNVQTVPTSSPLEVAGP